MVVQAYLFFEGRCEEALNFYKQALGAKVEMLMRFNQSPDPNTCASSGEKVMHAQFKVGETTLMASDGRCSGAQTHDGYALSIAVKTADEANKLFAALSADGGQVRMPLTKTFFSEAFGMCADKFGVGWMVLVESQMK